MAVGEARINILIYSRLQSWNLLDSFEFSAEGNFIFASTVPHRRESRSSRYNGEKALSGPRSLPKGAFTRTSGPRSSPRGALTRTSGPKVATKGSTNQDKRTKVTTKGSTNQDKRT